MTSIEQGRITPLNPPYEPEIDAMLKKWMPPTAPALDPLALFRVLALNPALMDRMRPLAAGFLGKASLLNPLERELVIDRVCARCGCAYEWGVHVAAFGQVVELSAEKLAGTFTLPANDPLWSEKEQTLLQLVDELHETAHVSDELWAKLAGCWNQAQILELITLVGWYHTIAFLANVTQIQPEPWAAAFPAV